MDTVFGHTFWAAMGRVAFVGILLSGCNTKIYVKDGVTDGDRFSLPSYVYETNDPVVQSWVAYSLARSFCQLEIGGPNPARNHSFDCELTSRESLLERWRDYGSVGDGAEHPDAVYLYLLGDADAEGFLDEYVWQYLRRDAWRRPADLDEAGFKAWRSERSGWRKHRPQTKIIGSWGYTEPAPWPTLPPDAE
ncbi:MAG: hypothetical protein AB8F65_05485 [Woeseiaceae bacterium]